MRYIVEAKTKKAEGQIEELAEKEKNIEIVDRYDQIVKISRDLEKMGEAIRLFKKSGIDWSIFMTYLKGRGIPRAHIDAVIGETEVFLKRLGLLDDSE